MGGIIDNLENALQICNEKLAEIWLLLTQYPKEFEGDGIWEVIMTIHGNDRQFNDWLYDKFYKRGYNDEVGTILRKSYEDCKIKSIEEFEEVLVNVLSNRKKI